ncbi:MAG: hypothetical protein LDL53_05205 [Candidatus Hydrogenedens sp.]|nr:hypothetical protein [Candidatus Hydrogenedens sp.]
MIRIRTLVFIILLIQLLVVIIAFFEKWQSDIKILHKENIDIYVTSNYKMAEVYVNKANDTICSIIEMIQSTLEKKSLTTTDRVLLNLFFIPILNKNKFIKKIEVVLPNKYEYQIINTTSGWQTISQTSGEKGFVRKKAEWTEDGMQMLEEVSEEVSAEQSMTNTEWYKEAVSLCLQQHNKNRKGIPKIWITKPEVNENGNAYRSFIALAVGYEDAPFSVVSLEMEWSWLQNTVTDIYRDFYIHTYIIKDNTVLCKLGMENISNREISQFSMFNNLPQEIKDIVQARKEEKGIYSLTEQNNIVIAKDFRILYDYPMLFIFSIPYPKMSFNPILDLNIWMVILLCVFVFFILTIVANKMINKPLTIISEWLENPNITNEKPAIRFKIFEFNNLMNKIHAILYFWKTWAETYEENKSPETSMYKGEQNEFALQSLEEKQRKDILIFSNEGRGGIAIESVQSLYRENIRLQRHIELVNQYYQQRLELQNKERMRIEGQLLAIKDVLRIVSQIETSPDEKIKNVLDILLRTLSITGVGIWKIDKNGTIIPEYLCPSISVVPCNYDDCKYLIEQLEWLECISIRSASQDYRSQAWSKILNAESIMFVPINKGDNSTFVKIILVFDTRERNWEKNDELFVITISNLISKMEEREDKKE